jgi:hypothetical protein
MAKKTTTEQKIRAVLQSLKKLNRRLKALQAAQARAESPTGRAVVEARKARQSAKVEAQEARLDTAHAIFETFAEKLGCSVTPTVLWSRTPGACNKVMRGGHIHAIPGIHQGLVCLGSQWRKPWTEKMERELHLLAAELVIYLHHGTGRRPNRGELADYVATLLGPAEATVWLQQYA